MVVRIRLTPEGRRSLAAVERAGRGGQVNRRVLRYFDRRSTIVAGQISREVLRRHRVTGTLARSITGRSELLGGSTPAMRVGIFRGPSLAYAGVQEFGTKGKNPASPFDTIRPRKAKALAIPKGPALTAAGVPRFLGPRNFPGDLHFVRFLSGGGAIGGLFTEDDELAFLLVAKVDIAPKFYLRDGFERTIPQTVNDLAGLLRDLAAGRPQRNV